MLGVCQCVLFSAEIQWNGVSGTLQTGTEVHVSRFETCTAMLEDKSWQMSSLQERASLYLVGSRMEALGSTVAAIFADVSSAVIQFSKKFPLCAVMTGAHCNTSDAACMPIIFRGRTGMSEE